MRSDGHSLTALNVALRRAAHQLYDDRPRVLEDEAAVRLMQTRYGEHLARTPAARGAARPYSSDIRAWVVARSRYADDLLAEVRPRQLLVLGAGLDTVAFRRRDAAMRVFEVDHPATQVWKRELLQEAGMAIPPNTVLVPLDFESGARIGDAVAAAGFDLQTPAVVTWLGVVMYLRAAGFAATMEFLGGLARGSVLVLDYYRPRRVLPAREQLMLDSLMLRVAQAGEPFRLFFTEKEAAAAMARYGFAVVEDLGHTGLNARYFVNRTDDLQLRNSTARLLCARLR